MSNFIKLSNVVINTRYITKIIIKPSIYSINLIQNDCSGIIVGSSLLFWGHLPPVVREIEISSIDTPDDYKIITNWLTENKL